MNDETDKRLIEPIEYVLGEISEGERSAFERRLSSDVQLREELSEAEALVVALRELPEDGWNPVEPPPFTLPSANGHDRDWLPAGEFSEPRPTPSEPAPAPAREPAALAPATGPTAKAGLLSRWRIPVMVGAAAGFLLLGLVIGALLGGDGGDVAPVTTVASEPPQQVISESRLRPAGPEGRSARGDARVLRDQGGDQSLAVAVDGVPASGPGRYYELWLMRGGELISLGGFKVGEAGVRRVEVPLPVDPASYELIDISLERVDGAPGHSATSLLRGPA